MGLLSGFGSEAALTRQHEAASPRPRPLVSRPVSGKALQYGSERWWWAGGLRATAEKGEEGGRRREGGAAAGLPTSSREAAESCGVRCAVRG